MKIAPKTILFLSVAAFAAVGGWWRAAYAKPWIDRRAADRTVRHLEGTDTLKMGDIVFQTSRSAQSRAIQEATHSPWSHCGILVRRKGSWSVLEATQLVKCTLLSEWIARGKNGKFLVMRVRLSSNQQSSRTLQALVDTGSTFLGNPTTHCLDGRMIGSTARSWFGRPTIEPGESTWVRSKLLVKWI